MVELCGSKNNFKGKKAHFDSGLLDKNKITCTIAYESVTWGW